MANVRAFRNGTWSDTNPATSPWGTGGVLYAPASTDVVYANNFLISMDVTTVTGLTLTNATSASILFKDGATTTATAGGYFNITTSGITINANIIGGTGTNTNSTLSVVNMSLNAPSTAFIVGDCTGSSTVGSTYASRLGGTGTLTITGNVVGGSGGSGRNAVNIAGVGDGVTAGSGGVLNINGNISGGTGTDNCGGLSINSLQGTINVVGNVTAGSNGGANNGIRVGGAQNVLNVTATTISCVASTATSSAIDTTNSVPNVLNITATTITGGYVNGQGTIAILNAYAVLNLESDNILGGTFLNVSSYAVYFTNSRVSSTIKATNITGGAVGGSQPAIYYNANGNGDIVNLTIGPKTGGTLTLTGGTASNCPALLIGNPGYIVVNGTCTASSIVEAVRVDGQNTRVEITKAVGNGYGTGSVGISNVASVSTTNSSSYVYIREIELGSRGQWPINGPAFILPSTSNVFTAPLSTSGTKTLVDPNSTGLMPSASNVRLGTTYSSGNLIGTMAVPSANSVAVGVSVGNTTGTAVLTPSNVWNYSLSSASAASGSVGEKLKKTANTSDLIALG